MPLIDDKEIESYLLPSFSEDGENGFDDGIAKPFNEFVRRTAATIKQLSQQVAGLQTGNVQNEWAAVTTKFDKICDDLGQPELLGKSGQLSPEQYAARERLLVASGHLSAVRGKKLVAGLDQALVSKTLHMEFGDQLIQQERNKITERIRKQSANRLGVGKSRTGPPKYEGPLEKDPELLAYWDELRSSSE